MPPKSSLDPSFHPSISSGFAQYRPGSFSASPGFLLLQLTILILSVDSVWVLSNSLKLTSLTTNVQTSSQNL